MEYLKSVISKVSVISTMRCTYTELLEGPQSMLRPHLLRKNLHIFPIIISKSHILLQNSTKIWHFKNNWIKDRVGKRERRGEQYHRQPQGSIDSLSLFIFSLRNDGHTHFEPPHPPLSNSILMATVHSGQTLSMQSLFFTSTVSPASAHLLVFLFCPSVLSLSHQACAR